MRLSRSVKQAIVVALVAAAIAASCSSDSTDAGETEQAETETGAENGSGPVDLSRLELGFGQGSLAAQAVDMLFPADELGPGWIDFAAPETDIESCNLLPSLATAKLAYLEVETQSVVEVTIEIHADAEAAESRHAILQSEAHEVCLVDKFDEFQKDFRERTSINVTTERAVGELIDPLLDNPGAFTRWFTAQLDGQGYSDELVLTATWYAQDSIVVGIAVQGIGEERHQELAPLANSLLALETDLAGDPAIDAGVDRLRLGVLGPESPAEFYQLVEAAVVEPPDPNATCTGEATESARLVGPLWATANSASAIHQGGWTLSDPESAAQRLRVLATVDAACLAEEFNGALNGTIELTETTTRSENIDGRTIEVLEISMLQTLGEELSAEIAFIQALIAIGSEVIGWQFLGIRGDEPDVVSLAVETVEQFEAANS